MARGTARLPIQGGVQLTRMARQSAAVVMLVLVQVLQLPAPVLHMPAPGLRVLPACARSACAFHLCCSNAQVSPGLLPHRLQVLPGAFMVTAPHARANSWRPVPGSARDADHLTRIGRVYEAFKARVAAQTRMQPHQSPGGM